MWRWMSYYGAVLLVAISVLSSVATRVMDQEKMATEATLYAMMAPIAFALAWIIVLLARLQR